jgi:crotonobetainyl-CoA:carnitine CoA-transferase CaiB-like acyl-CoA transferase
MLGQHTEQVLTEMVGLSQEEYRSLVDDGVLE